MTLQLPDVINGQGYHAMLWQPDRPSLIDATVMVGDDVVASYLGLRTVGVEGGQFMLNGEPCYLRSVLSQGYWPESHLAAPSAEALRREVELVKEARVQRRPAAPEVRGPPAAVLGRPARPAAVG